MMLIVVSLIGYNVGVNTTNNLRSIQNKVLPAIAAVLNADRDLYQARVAELDMLAGDQADFQGLQADCQENA